MEKLKYFSQPFFMAVDAGLALILLLLGIAYGYTRPGVILYRGHIHWRSP